ncbi:Pharynx and intestine in excess protein 1 [Dionaea muscipula]
MGEDTSYKLLLASPSREELVVSPQVDSEDSIGRENRIANAAAAARSAQPTGNTFLTTKVRTKFPFLLKYPLREYQHIGLDWLVTMYEKRLNGILADEMGLGKTIMTIALLAHLACEKGIWGPHLIVVPTSVMLNWETEFLKWCPAFKILTYFGSAKQRRLKRQGWMKPNSFHVCITTYRLVIQDSKAFKRKKWKYLILDEAHLIKNWKSQRWQTLLNFNSKRRILLTGTPLQNDLMELWSLMHFLMPHVFQSHQEFKDWFSNPISGMVEGQEKVNKEVVDRLHNVLRPFILRRLKRDVETQLPMKQEHVLYCRLSKRQRNLYEDFIASSETQATLASSNFFGMLNVIMQLRKVCNHPDLFEGRPIVSSFDMVGIDMQLSSAVCSILSSGPFSGVDLSCLGLVFTFLDFRMTSWESDETQSLAVSSRLIEERASMNTLESFNPLSGQREQHYGTSIFEDIRKAILEERLKEAKKRAAGIAWWNSLRCQRKPIYSSTLRDILTLRNPLYDIHLNKSIPVSYEYSSKLADIVLSPVERLQTMIYQVESFMFAIPAARAPPPVCWCSKTGTSAFINAPYKEKCSEILLPLLTPIRPAIVRRQLYFPDRRLIQYDCGKLQQLALLLRRLRSEGHRALIFTQMTKMLDILEAFINLYGYTYMRLDGSTQPEERQTLMQRFNSNPKIFLFILSTRSGGVGINLVGADTVIFYDSDWNPAMDQQAQDRCHRIGQTREVHIYRLISESTIEENILKKANQKRVLDNLVIQSGGYNTEFFTKLDPMELFSGHGIIASKNMQKEKSPDNGIEVSVSNVDLEAALRNAEDEADYMALKKVEEEEAVDNQEFTEEAIAQLEDDDLANEDDWRPDEYADQTAVVVSNKESVMPSNGNDHDGEKSRSFNCDEDEVDMLADVKQMAAAAAATGDAISSLENQLCPIDRYAMRFLELWDPIIDRTAVDSEIQFDEKQWELERIEKLKEDMEAEIDDDEEPFVYESWDADFATQAYRQQVEALAQYQLMEELETKAKEEEEAEAKDDLIRNDGFAIAKPKSKKKKTKKTKFKSLKKGSLGSSPKTATENSIEPMLLDDGDAMPVQHKSVHKKRKNGVSLSDSEEEKTPKVKFKKAKKASVLQFSPIVDSNVSGKTQECKHLKQGDNRATEVELKPAVKGKMEGRISITAMPVKRVLTLKPEKLKKKGTMWSSDYIPLPDSWTPPEDAVLCALVHEYGLNWRLVSETLYGMTAGGFFRGRFRHPVHCSERYRELCQKYVLSVADSLNIEKPSNAAPAKAVLKVSEENIHMLLDVAMELPDRELLLQKHFTALLSSVWKLRQRSALAPLGGGGKKLFGSPLYKNSQSAAGGTSEKFTFTNLHNCRKLLRAALDDADGEQRDGTAPLSEQMEAAPSIVERLDVSLELGEIIDGASFPSAITLSIPGIESLPLVNMLWENHLKPSQQVAENRFRAASSASLDGSFIRSSAFCASNSKSLLGSKPTLLGKHKQSTAETNKTSKSKIRKTAYESSETYPQFIEPTLPGLPRVGFSNLELLSDSFRSLIPDGGGVLDSPLNGTLCGEEGNFRFGTSLFFLWFLDEESPSEVMSLIPHCYEPGLISGLDDCTLLPEYTDIG